MLVSNHFQQKKVLEKVRAVMVYVANKVLRVKENHNSRKDFF